MATYNAPPDEATGLAEIAIDDVDGCGCGKDAPAGVPPTPPVSGWTMAIQKAADICLNGSMYILYPAILIVICIDVIGRNFFETPLSWAIEGSGLFLIGAIFLAVPRVELDRTHILLDILYANYKPRTKLICDLLTRALAFLWMVAATIRSSFEIPTAFMLNESGADFRYPFWPMRVVMTVGFLMLTLALLYNVVDSYYKLRQGGQK